MNLLILWMCLGLAGFLGSTAPVSGMPFFEDNDFMGGIKQYLGSLTASDRTPADTSASHNKTAGGAVQESSSGFYDEMDTALEHATDTVDGMWKQFRKGLLSLMGSFSGSDDDGDGIAVATTMPSLQQIKPISTGAPIKTATNKVIATGDIPTTETPTTTELPATLGTSSTVPTTTVAPPASTTVAPPDSTTVAPPDSTTAPASI